MDKMSLGPTEVAHETERQMYRCPCPVRGQERDHGRPGDWMGRAGVPPPTLGSLAVPYLTGPLGFWEARQQQARRCPRSSDLLSIARPAPTQPLGVTCPGGDFLPPPPSASPSLRPVAPGSRLLASSASLPDPSPSQVCPQDSFPHPPPLHS